MFLKLPPKATQLISAIKKNGGQGFLVGGALRDLLLGKTPTDWDFATDLLPHSLLGIFEGARLIGGQCGTVQVPFGEGFAEITPFRLEGEYVDKRHPQNVVFTKELKGDLARRDFTVNAMAFDGQVLQDYFGGMEDLAKKCLRCVGPAACKFNQDALRVLRLFRFAAELGFKPDKTTLCAAMGAMQGLNSLPKERVFAELGKILQGDAPQVVALLINGGGLKRFGLFAAPNLQCLQNVPNVLIYRLWALCTLCGANVKTVCEGFGLSNKFCATLLEIKRLHCLGAAANVLELKQKLCNCRLNYLPIAKMFTALFPSFKKEKQLFLQLLQSQEPYRMFHLAVNGNMLRYKGIKGKDCGRVLKQLLNLVIKNPQFNQADILLEIAKSLQRL